MRVSTMLVKCCILHKVQCEEKERGRVVCFIHKRKLENGEWEWKEECETQKFLRVTNILWDTEKQELLFQTE